jgi:molybdopterin synthase sulfur carrier subunit
MSNVTVKVPTPLQKLTGNQAQVTAEGNDIGEVIDDLEKNHPGLKERLCLEDGQIRRFVNIFLNGEDIRFKDGKSTKLAEGDELSIIPAIAGGGR